MDEQFTDDYSIQEEPRKRNFTIPIIVLILIVVIGGTLVLTLSGKIKLPGQTVKKETEEIKKQAISTPVPKIKASQKALQQKLASSVKNLSAPSSSPGSKPAVAKYPDIQKNIEAAQKEPSLDKSYQYYVKAYAAMLTAYKETKDTKYITAIKDLKKIVVRYPQYKAGDFP